MLPPPPLDPPNNTLHPSASFFPVAFKALREIGDHENIVRLFDVFPNVNGIVLVFECLTSDLQEVLQTHGESPASTTCGMFSFATFLFSAVEKKKWRGRGKQNDILHSDKR